MTDDRGVTSWRAYWPVTVLAVTFLAVVVLFGTYLTARQHAGEARQRAADARAEKQRRALCDTLANIPGHIPAEIARDRIAFARPGHPGECQPIRGAATPKPIPIPVTINGTPGVIVVQPGPVPTRTVTATPRPRPTPTRSPRPSPSPKPKPDPSPTCLAGVCLPAPTPLDAHDRHGGGADDLATPSPTAT